MLWAFWRESERGIGLSAEHVFVTPGEVRQLIDFQSAAEELILRRDQASAKTAIRLSVLKIHARFCDENWQDVFCFAGYNHHDHIPPIPEETDTQ